MASPLANAISLTATRSFASHIASTAVPFGKVLFMVLGMTKAMVWRRCIAERPTIGRTIVEPHVSWTTMWTKDLRKDNTPRIVRDL